jgi:hypothetical protein
MALQQELDTVKERFEHSISDHTAQIMEDFTRSLRDSGISERALKQGQQMPDFSLPAAAGGTVRLTEILDSGPAVVFFYRGSW